MMSNDDRQWWYDLGPFVTGAAMLAVWGWVGVIAGAVGWSVFPFLRARGASIRDERAWKRESSS